MTKPGPEEDPSGQPLELTGRSRQLLDVLVEFKCDAAVLYQGALRVARDGDNPVRIRLVAHALRELMDDLEREAGFTWRSPSLPQRVRKLQDEWKVARLSLADGPEGSESAFDQTLDEFFTAFESDYPRRRDQASNTIGKLDPSGREAPPAVREARARSWMRFRYDFNAVAHGSTGFAEADFLARLDSFEGFLLDWFEPRTFADFEAIDELLERGPPDG